MATALSVLGCAGGAERLVLQRFFDAARLRDRTALRSIATVVFEPLDRGTITTFRIVDLGVEERQPLDAGSPGPVAELSLTNPARPIDPLHAEAELISKTVRIAADVTDPDGRTARKTLRVTLERAVLKSEPATIGQWIVTGVVTSP